MFGEGAEPLEEIDAHAPDLSGKNKAITEIKALNVAPAPKRKRSRKAVDEDSPAMVQATARGELIDAVQVVLDGSEDAESDAVAAPKRKRKTEAKAPTQQTSGSYFGLFPHPLPDSPLAVSVVTNLALFPNCILPTSSRAAANSTTYFTQAPFLARILSIKLTSCAWGGQRIPMCGFPLTQLDQYLKILVQMEERFVVMCEEFPRPGEIGGFDRRVTRVVTLGTLIDESFPKQYEKNYLLAIATSPPSAAASASIPDNAPSDSNSLGLPWMDVLDGEFFTQHMSPSTVTNDVARIAPKEVILPASLRGSRLEEMCG